MGRTGTLSDALAAVDGVVESDGTASITQLLDIGAEALDVSGGYTTRIDQENDIWTVEAATNGTGGIGEIVELAETFCRKTITTGRLSLVDAANEGWTDDPAFERFGHSTYLGTRIDAAGSVGTVCFVDTDPRDHPFSAEEELLAEVISRRIEQLATTAMLRDRLGHLEGFVSLISHDLRNPLTVARGWVDAEQASAESDGLERALAALGRIEELIQDGVKMAREAKPVTDPEVVGLESAVESSWRTVDTRNSTLEVDSDFKFLADPMRLQYVFEPLFRNAVEHGREDVTVHVGSLDDRRGFYVEDDGPGIAEEIRDRVFEPGVSANGEGPGYGLATVKATVNAHGWSVTIDTESTDGARFEIAGVVCVPAQ